MKIGRRTLTTGALAAALPVRAAEPAWIDAHCHVFTRGPKLDYDASWQTLLELAQKNGVGRAVLLQPSFLGFDNAYLFEALRAEPGRFRGVPWVSPSIEISADDWEGLAQIGVRGLRFPIFGLPTPQWSAYRDMLGEALKRDWPHTDTGLDRVTTYPKTLRWFEEWVPDEAARHTILVDTPTRLYGF